MSANQQNILLDFWEQMAAIYDHAWVSKYGKTPVDAGRLSKAAQLWLAAFQGLKTGEIFAAIQACARRVGDYPPRMGEFRSMAKGVPSYEQVAAWVRAKQFGQPFARMVWHNLDTYRLRSADVREWDRLVRGAYVLAIEQVMAGQEPPPEPEHKLTHEAEPEFVPASPEVAAKHQAAIEQILNIHPKEEGEE